MNPDSNSPPHSCEHCRKLMLCGPEYLDSPAKKRRRVMRRMKMRRGRRRKQNEEEKEEEEEEAEGREQSSGILT